MKLLWLVSAAFVLISFPALAQDAWDPSRFTSPAQFRAGASYRFLVRAMRDGFRYQRENIGSPEVAAHYVQSLYNLASNPQAIAQVPALAASLIDEVRNETFGPCGVILEAPADNVVATSTEDMSSTRQLGWGHPTEEDFANLAKKYGRATPDDLLAHMQKFEGGYDYNEVVLRGTSPSGKTLRINGFFVRARDGTIGCSNEMYETLKVASERNSLPLISLPLK